MEAGALRKLTSSSFIAALGYLLLALAKVVPFLLEVTLLPVAAFTSFLSSAGIALGLYLHGRREEPGEAVFHAALSLLGLVALVVFAAIAFGSLPTWAQVVLVGLPLVGLGMLLFSRHRKPERASP